MNTIIAQGAPGGIIRKFQEQPQLAVALLAAVDHLITDNSFTAKFEVRKAMKDITGVDPLHKQWEAVEAAYSRNNREAYYAALDKYLAL